MDRFIRTLWGVSAILIAAGVAWLAADRWSHYEVTTARSALDARAGELVQRALTPGSPLACLDAIGNAAVEAACEKTLFAGPETVAAAVAYVDAELSLLADGLAHAARDPGYAAKLERLRRGLEADRFGMVAQALASRGCSAEACPALTLFRNPQRIAANLKERTFDANVVLHAAAWRLDGAAVAATSATPSHVPTMGLAGVPAPGKYEFPSASSIPPVSIMTAEPPLSKAEETAIATPAPAPAPEPAATPTTPAAPAKRPPPARRPTQPSTANVPLPPPAPITPGAGR